LIKTFSYHSKTPQSRLTALDGLRGVAAFVVVIFHFLSMLAPSWTPQNGHELHFFVDTPLAVLWNGPFAVSVFFVLSGFVISGVAAKRADRLIANIVSRYVRLVIPVTVSVLLAWLWLVTFPANANALADAFNVPPVWLEYTYQTPIPPFTQALADGIFLNFINGGSNFNNVLWTMQIELLGSIGLFIIYGIARDRPHRVALGLGLAVLATGLAAQFAYLAFALGAILQELWRRGRHRGPWAWLAPCAFVTGVALGGFSDGAHDRLGLPLPFGLESVELGHSGGVAPVLAATLILYGVLASPTLERAFANAVAAWLGRISFPLYLVHVPLLYTIVAEIYLTSDLGVFLLFPLYIIITVFLAQILTLLVEEPTLKLTRWLRAAVAGAGRVGGERTNGDPHVRFGGGIGRR
jgi:peptidoglycan/LPS O-acetylase OafA/YrhL